MAGEDTTLIKCTSAELATVMREAQATAVEAFIQDANLRVRGQTSYYSTVRFQLQATGVAPGPYTITLQNVERQAFSYSLGQSMVVAGFIPPAPAPVGGSGAAAASLTQTNLSQPKATRNGERMIITGISSFVSPDSDMELAAWVWQHANVQLVKNDNLRSPLGPLSFFPALSSLHGDGTQYNREPAFNEIESTLSIFRQSEGMIRNFDLSAAPVIWMPQGQTDGSLYIAVNLDEALSFVANDRAAVAGTINAWSARAVQNSAPNGPFATPTNIVAGSFCDVIFRFDGTTEALMSQNQGT